MKIPHTILYTLILALLLSGCQQAATPLKTVRHANKALVTAAFSQNNQYALVAEYAKPAALWDLKTNKPLYSWALTAGENAVTDLSAIARNNKMAATAGAGQLVLWNMKNGGAISEKTFKHPIRAVALAADKPFVLVGSSDYRAYYFNVNKDALWYTFLHDGSVNSVALSNDGKYALTGGDDDVAKLWELENGKLVHTWKHSRKVTFVTFSKDSKYALTNASQKEVIIWDVNSGKQVTILKGPNISITSADFSRDNKRIITGNTNGKLNMWNRLNGEMIKQWRLPRENIWRPTTVIILAVSFINNDTEIMTEDSTGANHIFKST